jgi:hypothetical protein
VGIKDPNGYGRCVRYGDIIANRHPREAHQRCREPAASRRASIDRQRSARGVLGTVRWRPRNALMLRFPNIAHASFWG